ncbi:bifunctional glutamate N-acetyltransferase/amino-acid acetyltransferase ArgJ [Chloroflexota bacterium]
MESKINPVVSGTVTSPRGFYAGAVYSGIKQSADGVLDLGILLSQVKCVAAALFTNNKVKAAPVVLSRERIRFGKTAGVVVNSGCANAATGEPGLADAAEMAELAAAKIGVSSEDVLVASTGVIGERLPMNLIREGIGRINPSENGGHDLEKAIMTTDTVPKETAVTARAGDARFTIGGVAKGSGMIHPDMGTMLCFLTTDAAVDKDFLDAALRRAANISFNMVSIDGDTSTNDMVLVMANGLAGNDMISASSGLVDIFQQALNRVCVYLARELARDGEGATRLIEVTVSGGADTADARQTARTVANSYLVKSAVHGSDPNWGRVMAAAGRSGAAMVEAKTDLYIGDICLVRGGAPLPFDREAVVAALSNDEVRIDLRLNLGDGEATAWGCDLSEEYVTINSQYTT